MSYPARAYYPTYPKKETFDYSITGYTVGIIVLVTLAAWFIYGVNYRYHTDRISAAVLSKTTVVPEKTQYLSVDAAYIHPTRIFIGGDVLLRNKDTGDTISKTPVKLILKDTCKALDYSCASL